MIERENRFYVVPRKDPTYYTVFPSPLGNLGLLASAQGLRWIWWSEMVALLTRIWQHEQLPLISGPVKECLGMWRDWLTHYFDGLSPPRAQGGALDLRNITPFQKQLLPILCSIPYGETWSYGQVAREMGSHALAHAVGRACAANPLPIVIPCHRVVSQNGTLGGYTMQGIPKSSSKGVSGSLKVKAWLLSHERQTVTGRIDKS